MAETSYPFSQSSKTGGTEMVSEVQWQAMAAMWGGDRVDFRLTSESYASGALPFSAAVINGRTIEIQPGRAWVGGFYYQLTASASLTVEANPTDKARKDTVVLRADLAQGSVNLSVVKGQPSASPIAPLPKRIPGQQWEMVLYEVDVPAKDGSPQLSLRAPFDMPPAVGSPWNTRSYADFLPVGTFLYDMDNNGGDTPYEAFKGRDGYMVTRHLGKSRMYSPGLANAVNVPANGMVYKGRWRWIAPNVVYYSISISNTTTTNIRNRQDDPIGFALPQQANGDTGQVLTGHMRNMEYRGGLANFVQLQALCWPGGGSTHASIFHQNSERVSEGMDALRVLPGRSTIFFSGTYETNIYSE
ncbi:hypothetical protein [Streptomyces sp. UNOB3_S3]|uniref:hypothetical protein n=1 Tax=Streptomyces sp. UNOB3_S3 TaxID=2871682 RepID=UPI001E28FAC7|nr:hypothetical protein [Streptomyces sp. UNOB3_S3]MCC3773666.1 hypothetical protein [Streptomyces sp. UNOB3_S3]